MNKVFELFMLVLVGGSEEIDIFVVVGKVFWLSECNCKWVRGCFLGGEDWGNDVRSGGEGGRGVEGVNEVDVGWLFVGGGVVEGVDVVKGWLLGFVGEDGEGCVVWVEWGVEWGFVGCYGCCWWLKFDRDLLRL